MKVLVAEKLADSGIEALREHFDVDVETGLSPDTLAKLRERGQRVLVGSTSGSANSILVTPQGLTGAGDPRQRGTLAEGY